MQCMSRDGWRIETVWDILFDQFPSSLSGHCHCNKLNCWKLLQQKWLNYPNLHRTMCNQSRDWNFTKLNILGTRHSGLIGPVSISAKPGWNVGPSTPQQWLCYFRWHYPVYIHWLHTFFIIIPKRADSDVVRCKHCFGENLKDKCDDFCIDVLFNDTLIMNDIKIWRKFHGAGVLARYNMLLCSPLHVGLLFISFSFTKNGS